jgi:ribose 5-phosphate isomerase B
VKALSNKEQRRKRTKSVTEETAIWIGNDHGGFELKSQIVEHLASKGIAVHDVGCPSEEIVRYPYYAAAVAEAIVRQEASRGILICSTGIGMSIIANRYRGIRASLCTSVHMGKMTRAHNDSNILCLGGKITEASDALEILDAWLATPFEGGRHQISLGLIRDAESAISSCGVWGPLDPITPGKHSESLVNVEKSE